jgi:hypothetical protein
MPVANFGGQNANSSVAITVFSPLQSWRLAKFGSSGNIGNGADNADPYQTGIKNLSVFAFLGPNQNPAQAAVSQLPQLQKSGGNYFFNFTQPTGVSGIIYGAEWSTTLAPGSWQSITDSGTGGQHLFSVPVGSNNRLYLRLKVTDP